MSRLKKNGKQLIEQRLNLDIERSMEMTKPEIIKQLKIELSVWESDCKSHHKTKDALKAAIERLEQDTVSRETYESEYIARKQAELELWKIQQNVSDDCVSRKEVDHLCFEFLRANSDDNIAFYEHFRDLPSVTPIQRWIPVSERLPKEGETVLVCYQAQGGIAQSVCEWFDMPNRGIVWSTLCGRTPIAWMPLPEPYKVEKEIER